MIPHYERITKAQVRAVKRLYDRSPSGFPSYRAFRRTALVSHYLGCVMLRWCDMWIGIETDGYTHS